MKKHSVIIGSGGRLGSALQTACSSEHAVTGLKRKDLDLADLDSIRTILRGLDYDTLWLTAALTDVDYCEANPEQTAIVNTEAAQLIAQISAQKNAQVILFSTDYVFDGEKNDLYLEDDDTHPLNVYGRSKQLAEEQVLAVSDQHLVIRLSWLFGQDKPGFTGWAIHQAMKTDSLSVVSNRRSSPTYTNDVIAAISPLISGQHEASGILHLCNQGVCSWREWAQFCVDCAAENGLPLLTREVGSCEMGDIESFTAQRPAFSAMSTERYQSLTGQQMPDWQEAVSHYIREYLAPRIKKEGNI